MPERFFIPVDRPQGNDGTPLLTRTAARHTARLFAALRPLIGSLGKELRSLLLARPYDVAQIRAFLAISPLAAARAGSTAVFLEQVREQARILAGWNVPDEEVRDTLREFDAVTGRALGGRHAPQREQLQLATLLVLNQAYYEFRETEAQALFGFDRAELDSESLEDRLGRVVRILTKAVRARAGRLVLTERLPDRRLARALYISDAVRAAQLILDETLRTHHAAWWSYPMPGVGVIQFGFALPRPWLPRELALLGAAATRCREAVQYRRMEASQREAEESERRRIGRELHDETGQSLLLLRLELEMLEREAPEPLRWRLRGARGIAEKTVEDVRRIVAALSPAMLERLGLPAALRQLAARFHRTCRTSVRIRLSNGFPLSAEAQQTIYRIAQESLQNAAKHSHATLVNLSLIETDKHVRLTVRDNGAGFRASIPDPRNISFGLTGMRERAEGCGGNLTVRSAPGMGTKVTLRLPTKTVRAVQHGVQHGKDTRTSHG